LKGTASNADSLGHKYWEEYLTNLNDTFGILTGDSLKIRSITADTFRGYLKGTASYSLSSLNADSLGHLYYDRYLTNINDTFGFLAGDTIQIGDAK